MPGITRSDHRISIPTPVQLLRWLQQQCPEPVSARLPEPISEFTFEDAKRLAGVTEPLLTPDERLQMIEFARRKQDSLR